MPFSNSYQQLTVRRITITGVLITTLAVNNGYYFLLKIIFLKNCKLKILNWFYSLPTWRLWLIKILLTLQYTNWSKPSLPVTFVAGTLALVTSLSDNTYAKCFKWGDVWWQDTGVLACHHLFKMLNSPMEQSLMHQMEMF